MMMVSGQPSEDPATQAALNDIAQAAVRRLERTPDPTSGLPVCPYCGSAMAYAETLVYAHLVCTRDGCAGFAQLPLAWLDSPWMLFRAVRAFRRAGHA